MINEVEKILIQIGVVVAIFAGLLTGNLFAAIMLALSYLILFYLPGLFWISDLKLSIIGKFLLLNIIGLVLVPFIYYVIGSAGLPINMVTVLLTPLLVLILGFLYKKKRIKPLS